MAFRFTSFTPVSQSSAKAGYHYQQSGIDYYIDKLGLYNWESHPHSQFPQELVFKLESRTEVAHLVLQAKPEKEIDGLTVYVGD